MTNSEVLGLEGEVGSFNAKVVHHPRYIDLEACTACGECDSCCPSKIPLASLFAAQHDTLVQERQRDAFALAARARYRKREARLIREREEQAAERDRQRTANASAHAVAAALARAKTRRGEDKTP